MYYLCIVKKTTKSGAHRDKNCTTTMAQKNTAKKMNLFTAFIAKHKGVNIADAAAHYRTNPYNYIVGWLERNGVEQKRKVDIAINIMGHYGIKFA